MILKIAASPSYKLQPKCFKDFHKEILLFKPPKLHSFFTLLVLGNFPTKFKRVEIVVTHLLHDKRPDFNHYIKRRECPIIGRHRPF